MLWLHHYEAHTDVKLSETAQCYVEWYAGTSGVPWWFLYPLGKDGHSLHLGDEKSEREREGRTTSLESGNRGEFVVVVPSSSGFS